MTCRFEVDFDASRFPFSTNHRPNERGVCRISRGRQGLAVSVIRFVQGRFGLKFKIKWGIINSYLQLFEPKLAAWKEIL